MRNVYRPRRVRDRQVVEGRRLPEIGPAPERGDLEDIADELSDWVATTGDSAAELLMHSDRAPFAAQATEQEQGRYYALTLFNPDGSPNAQAWQQTYARTGPYGLVEAVRGAEKWRTANGLPTKLPPPQGQAGAEQAMTEAQAAQAPQGPGAPPQQGLAGGAAAVPPAAPAPPAAPRQGPPGPPPQGPPPGPPRGSY